MLASHRSQPSPARPASCSTKRNPIVSTSDASASVATPKTSARSISLPLRSGRTSTTSHASFNAARIAAIIPLAE